MPADEHAPVDLMAALRDSIERAKQARADRLTTNRKETDMQVRAKTAAEADSRDGRP